MVSFWCGEKNDLKIYGQNCNTILLMKLTHKFSPPHQIDHFVSLRRYSGVLSCCFYLMNSAKRLARALPPKPTGMNLNSNVQDRGRSYYCCSA